MKFWLYPDLPPLMRSIAKGYLFTYNFQPIREFFDLALDSHFTTPFIVLH